MTGTREGDLLRQKLKAYGNPIVVYLNSDGTEVDRTMGYSRNPEEYKKKVEKILKDEDTYFAIKREYEKNPGNIDIIFKLANKYFLMGKWQESKNLYKSVITDSKKAKKTVVSLPDGNKDEKVNAYEYAMYMAERSISIGAGAKPPRGLLDFVEEFPDSKYTIYAYQRLSNYYTYAGTKEERDAFFSKAMKKYPDNKVITESYLRYCLTIEDNFDEAIKAGNKALSNYSFYTYDGIRENLAGLLKHKKKL